jgi:phosphoribosylformylglycinamidine synthase
MPRGLGFAIRLPEGDREDIALFSESQSRVVVSVRAERTAGAEDILAQQGIGFMRLGTVTAGAISVNGHDFGPIARWSNLYQNALTSILEQ